MCSLKQCDKIAFITKKEPFIKRGAFTTASRFCSLYREQYDMWNIDDVKDINELRKQYKKLLLISQVPKYYVKCGWQYTTGKDDIIYIRYNENKLFLNSYTNGFNSFISSTIKRFIPIITSLIVQKPIDKFPCIGFYNSPRVKPDSTLAFSSFIKSLKQKVDVYIMGDPLNINSSNIRNTFFTENNIELFEKCTHYFYYKSKEFYDPFPNSLLEAVENGKQIIVPDSNRPNKDGIDDVLSCIHYHKELTNKIFDNSNTILNAKNFDSFYKRIWDINWEYDISKTKYSNFREWCENEL